MLSFDLSGKDGPTSSYATAGIALRSIVPRKPPYMAKDAFVKLEIPQGGQWEDRKQWSLGVGQRRKTF
jgi:hypothetical protein